MVKVSKKVAEQNNLALANSADILSRQQGLDRVGLAEIAKHANLTTGAVYTHYGSREELLAAGLRAGFDRMVNWLDTLASQEDYIAHAQTKGRQSDGTLWCPAMSHVGTIRSASRAEQAAFAEGLERMLASMAQWPDVGSRKRALDVLSGLTGRMLFAGLEY